MSTGKYSSAIVNSSYRRNIMYQQTPQPPPEQVSSTNPSCQASHPSEPKGTEWHQGEMRVSMPDEPYVLASSANY